MRSMFAVSLLVAGAAAALYSLIGTEASAELPLTSLAVVDSLPAGDSLTPEFRGALTAPFVFDTASLGAAGPVADTSYVAAGSGKSIGGRHVSISVCGVDSRMGENVRHADANHVITLGLDSGLVEIVSIPRDTPCDAGFPGSTRKNNLSNLFARKGRENYLKEVAAIAGVDTIPYWVETGFSQARGVLELLGFRDNAGDALRVLRSRHAFSTGDFQRSFNQGQFMRQMLLRHFEDMEGIMGDMMLRAGLSLVTTNLTVDLVDSLAGELRAAGFSSDKERVTVAVRPAYYAKLSVFNFTDSASLGSLLTAVRKKSEKSDAGGSAEPFASTFNTDVQLLLTSARADTGKAPLRAVGKLRRPFDQRIWWQIVDRESRARLRKEMGGLLAAAYRRAGKNERAEEVERVVEFEEQMFTAEGSGAK